MNRVTFHYVTKVPALLVLLRDAWLETGDGGSLLGTACGLLRVVEGLRGGMQGFTDAGLQPPERAPLKQQKLPSFPKLPKATLNPKPSEDTNPEDASCVCMNMEDPLRNFALRAARRV